MSSVSRKPSKVVALKLPPSLLSKKVGELVDACRSYGVVRQYAHDSKYGRLLVEMDGEFSALKLLNEFKHSPPTVAGYSVRAYPTNLQELAVLSNSRPREVSPTRREKKGEFNPGYLKDDNSVSAVLCAHVDKETAEVTHDILRQAFAKYGRIVCLVSFRHKGILQCLVEYPDSSKAGDILKKLHGTPIYDDCCILRVCYSNLQKLEFRDDERRHLRLQHPSPQFELSKRTVSYLQVWSPKQDAAIAAKDKSKNMTATKNVAMGMIPRIPKLKAIASKRHVQPLDKNNNHKLEAERPSRPVPSKETSGNGLTVPRILPNNCSFISPPPLINIKANSIDASNTLGEKVPCPSETNHKLKPSKERDAGSDNSELPSSISKDGTKELKVEDDNDGIDKSLDTVPFTLILDPSDCSDIETASVSSECCQKKLSDNGCQVSPSCDSVATEAGCQDINLSSVGMQCDIVDEEMRNMATLCQEKLNLLKSQCAEIAELNERNRTLLEENAELKRLLTEVHDEITRLHQDLKSSPIPDSSTDSSTNVKAENEADVTRNHKVAPFHGSEQPKCKASLTDIPMFEAPSTATKHPGPGWPRKRSRSYDESSPGPSNHKKSSTHRGHEPLKKSRKLDKEKKKIHLSSLTKGIHNGNKPSNGYAKKIRNKFLFSLIDTFLKSQKFISVKVELMKEAMKSLKDGDLLQRMEKIVPQLDNISDATADLKKLSNLNMCGYEDALFSLISKLPDLFPDLIQQLDGTNLSIPGTSQTLLGVLRKMESLATDMCKYIPQSKTLAFGNAATGEATSVEDSSNTKPSDLLPPLSVDELLDRSEEHPTSLIVSISMKHLKPIGNKQSPNTEEDSPSPPLSAGGKRVCTAFVSESDQRMPSPPEAQESKTDSIVEIPTPDGGDMPTQDSVTEVFSTPDSSTLDVNIRSNTAECGNGACNSNGEVIIAKVTNPCVALTDNLANGSTTTAANEAPPPYCVKTVASVEQTIQTNETTPVLSAFPANEKALSTVVAPIRQAPPPIPTWNQTPPVLSDIRASCPAINNLGPFVPMPPAPIPPTPVVKINISTEGLVVKWTLQQIDIHLASQVESYCLNAFEGTSPPSPDQWETVGKMRALQLPMACTLTHFVQGTTYHFAVRAISKGGVCGQFSPAKSIEL